MQERDENLKLEEQMKRSGYYDWLSDNIGDLKAEYMTQYSVEELIQHFYWDEETIETFFDYHSDSFEEYCQNSWEATKEWELTKNDLNKRL